MKQYTGHGGISYTLSSPSGPQKYALPSAAALQVGDTFPRAELCQVCLGFPPVYTLYGGHFSFNIHFANVVIRFSNVMSKLSIVEGCLRCAIYQLQVSILLQLQFDFSFQAWILVHWFTNKKDAEKWFKELFLNFLHWLLWSRLGFTVDVSLNSRIRVNSRIRMTLALSVCISPKKCFWSNVWVC